MRIVVVAKVIRTKNNTVNPLLNIVTITRADPAGLTRTLASTTGWRGLSEVVHGVVDGDGSAEAVVCASGCRWIRQSGRGIADAFNTGLDAATGDWVWFLNGGDAAHECLHPEWLLTLLAHSSADVVVGGIHYDGESAPRRAPPLATQWPLTECWIPHPATIVRRKALQAVGRFDPRWRIAMDFDLWQRLLKRDTLVDVVSVPFARFDVTGLSHRAELRSVVQAEGSRIVCEHSLLLTRHALRGLTRVGATLLRAGRTCLRGRGNSGGLSTRKPIRDRDGG